MIVGVLLNVLPYFLTKGAYQADGQQLAGFPLTFHKIGGDCYPSTCENYAIQWFKLVGDVLIWTTSATLVAWVLSRRRIR